MTDLPEALPILRHNTDMTFGPSTNNGAASHGEDGCDAQEPYREEQFFAGGSARRPTIRKLCWGHAAEAGEVASAVAEEAATRDADSEWRGFDLIVVRARNAFG